MKICWLIEDILGSKGDFYIIEANPFSGAQLYESDTDIIVKEISEISR